MVPCIMNLDLNHCELQGASLHRGWPCTLTFLWRLFSEKRISLPGSIMSHIIVMYSGTYNKHREAQPEAESLHCYTCLWTAVVSIPLLLSSFSCPVVQRALLLGWSWIMEIDYAVTSQIPLPRAWPQSVWLQVGQACLRDALLAALEKGQSAGLPLQCHTASYHSKWKRITHVGRKEWRYPVWNTRIKPSLPDLLLTIFYPSNSSSPLSLCHLSLSVRYANDFRLHLWLQTIPRRLPFKFLKKSWVTSWGARGHLEVLNIFASSHVTDWQEWYVKKKWGH